jgi:hypothetical protein
MMTNRPEELELAAARDQWRRLATMQGMLCMSCNAIPSLEHRHAFYDTGLCETCAEGMRSGDG